MGNKGLSAHAGIGAALVMASCLAVGVFVVAGPSARAAGSGPVSLMGASELPRLDARIQRDEELLKSQEAIVQRAIEQRAGRGPAMMRRQQGRVPASRGRVHAGAQLAIGDSAGTGAAGAATANGRTPSSREGEGNQWEKRAVRRYLGDMERKSRLYGRFEGIPESYNQKEADDWGAFFDQLNTEVDVPKYDVKNLLVDNIEAIPPCNMDCGKHGEKDPKDFDWYNNLNTVNKRGKVVDNIDDITACLIDC